MDETILFITIIKGLFPVLEKPYTVPDKDMSPNAAKQQGKRGKGQGERGRKIWKRYQRSF
jgi:hypothetical protein